MEYNEKFAMTDVALAYLLGRDPKTDMGGNSTGFYMECQGNCDAERLEKAINGVIERQPIAFADSCCRASMQITNLAKATLITANVLKYLLSLSAVKMIPMPMNVL